jgi:hypothetical protein
MKYAGWGCLGFAVLLILAVVFYVLGWFGEAGTVAREQFGPKAAIRKYEWFKDAAAQLDKKRADIAVYAAQVEAAEKGDTSHRDVRQDISLRRAELAGMIASYNALAADYNAASSKFNWSKFEGDLPREVKEYRR